MQEPAPLGGRSAAENGPLAKGAGWPKRRARRGSAIRAGATRGKLYETCHEGRERQPKPTIQTAIKQLEASMGRHRRACLCTTKHPPGVLARGAVATAASTNTAFCGTHYNVFFAPLEKESFAATTEQIFLLTYRALGWQVFANEWQLACLVPWKRPLDHGLTLDYQVAIQLRVAFEHWSLSRRQTSGRTTPEGGESTGTAHGERLGDVDDQLPAPLVPAWIACSAFSTPVVADS